MPHKDPVAKLEYFREYRERNKDHLRERAKINARKRREVNSAKYLLAGKKWRDKNRELLRIRSRERIQTYKAFVNQLKGQSGCAICGYNADVRRLHFHHIVPETKLFAISSGWAHSLNAVMVEIAKCQILCVRCHCRETRTKKS